MEVKEARDLHEVRAVSCLAMGGLVPDGSRAPRTSSVCPESGSCMAAPGWTLHLLALIQASVVAACSVALPGKACVYNGASRLGARGLPHLLSEQSWLLLPPPRAPLSPWYLPESVCSLHYVHDLYFRQVKNH